MDGCIPRACMDVPAKHSTRNSSNWQSCCALTPQLGLTDLARGGRILKMGMSSLAEGSSTRSASSACLASRAAWSCGNVSCTPVSMVNALVLVEDTALWGQQQRCSQHSMREAHDHWAGATDRKALARLQPSWQHHTTERVCCCHSKATLLCDL